VTNAVKSLQNITADEVAEFGGKAVNLAVMLQAGLPVPSGFAVGLTAFNSSEKLPEELTSEILAMIDRGKAYAVRSSATQEDAIGASWAGQFETFLNVGYDELLEKIVECHNSATTRAKAYAADKSDASLAVAVVVQEMIDPVYAGVLFTRDPVTGSESVVTEYVSGLGESLVSGKADPNKLVLDSPESTQAPFDVHELTEVAKKIEALFAGPQDIEWAMEKGKLWVVQARPITTNNAESGKYDLGEPDDLFYWGPSRAVPLYMSDFVAAIERIFTEFANDKSLPQPPPTLVLFDQGKMVWLNTASAFADFARSAFTAYAALDRLEENKKSWHELADKLPSLSSDDFGKNLIDAWYYTEFAEFALYGAEAVLTEKLERLDSTDMTTVWGAFTSPDAASFLNRLDEELAEIRDPQVMAKKYPWIRDGYAGPNDEAEWYFVKRLEAIDKDGVIPVEDMHPQREKLRQKFVLSDNEIKLLDLARHLAEFMDERKAWMMQTRHLIKRPVHQVEHGWYFENGNTRLIDKVASHELWQRYVDFKSSTSQVVGTVANNGGKHFVSGEVAVLNSHVDPVENDKILVVPSTSPGWVPLMRHARALVTDHGGTLSHAAIVAREFNLPCIVGTKQGTKILKTGDNVVLNLTTGEVMR
jgi:phosphohistidine swiveling domain-containing protein